MMYSIRTIVAGVAEPGEQDPVLPAALELADRTGATLHLVHAFELPELGWHGHVGGGYGGGEMIWETTERIRENLEARVRNRIGGGRIRCHAVAGPAAATIQELARREHADLILVGATRNGVLRRKVLGTTAQRVLRGAPAPVLVLRDRLPTHLSRVLLTSDLTVFSAGIHEAGLDVVETLFPGDDPRVRSLFVLAFAGELPLTYRGESLERTARAELADFLAERRGRSGRAEGAVRGGDPATEILAETRAWSPDLLILGTHGRTGSRRLLLGSVAEAVVREVASNVLVIPAAVEAGRRLPVRRASRTELVAPGGR